MKLPVLSRLPRSGLIVRNSLATRSRPAFCAGSPENYIVVVRGEVRKPGGKGLYLLLIRNTGVLYRAASLADAVVVRGKGLVEPVRPDGDRHLAKLARGGEGAQVAVHRPPAYAGIPLRDALINVFRGRMAEAYRRLKHQTLLYGFSHDFLISNSY